MKGVANPLLWLLAVQIGCWWLLRRRSARPAKAVSVLLLGSTLIVWVIATQHFSEALERMWSPPVANQRDFRPTHLIVLAGGWRPGETPEEDFLEQETQRRVLHAVALWRRYTEARLVMSGWSGESGAYRHAGRQVELMAEAARGQGVPGHAIVLEPRAANTFEHPIEVLRLSGFTPGTPVGIVTSGWHMRRAYAEFSRHFGNVVAYPVAPLQRLEKLEAWTPTAGALRDSVTVLQEMAGMAWYSLRNALRS